MSVFCAALGSVWWSFGVASLLTGPGDGTPRLGEQPRSLSRRSNHSTDTPLGARQWVPFLELSLTQVAALEINLLAHYEVNRVHLRTIIALPTLKYNFHCTKNTPVVGRVDATRCRRRPRRSRRSGNLSKVPASVCATGGIACVNLPPRSGERGMFTDPPTYFPSRRVDDVDGPVPKCKS